MGEMEMVETTEIIEMEMVATTAIMETVEMEEAVAVVVAVVAVATTAIMVEAMVVPVEINLMTAARTETRVQEMMTELTARLGIKCLISNQNTNSQNLDN